MELKHDWKSLNQFLFSHASSKASTAFALKEKSGAIQAFDGKGDKLFETMDESSLNQLMSSCEIQKYFVFDQDQLQKRIESVSKLGSNYFHQVQQIRDLALNDKKDSLFFSQDHFLLELFMGWMKRFLPTRYNVLLFIDQRSSLVRPEEGGMPKYRALLLTFENGVLDQFYEPDFSALHDGRLTDWYRDRQLIGEYLENRYILPCYCIFTFQDVWDKMNAIHALKNAKGKSAGNPWRLFTKYHDEKRAVLYPETFWTKAFLATSRAMVYFGRL